MENKLKFCQSNIKQIDEQKGIIPFTLTSFTVDRDGDVIFPTGAVLGNFRKNPISLYMHNAWEVPPAKLLPETIVSNAQEMIGDVQFDIENDPFGEFLFKKYVNGFLSAGSIRFIPIEFDMQVVIEGQTGFGVKVWELLEFSLVTIPSNPEALRKEYKDGKSGLYESYEKPYYSAIEKFYEYHNRGLDVDKQIFSYCNGEGCKDISREIIKDTAQQQINSENGTPGTPGTPVPKETIKDEQSFLQEMTQSLKSIESILKMLDMPKPENKETKEEAVSDQQFLEMLESQLNSKDKKGV